MFLMVPPLLGRPVRRMLVIGNAGGTIARAYGEPLPGRRDRRRRDRPEGDRGRAALPRPRGQPAPPRRHGRRPPFPPDDRRALRRDRRRRLPPALHPVLPRDAGVLPARPRAARARRRARPERRRGARATTGCPRRSAARSSPRSPRRWRWKPLRFNELMLGFDRPLRARRAPRPRRAGRLARSHRSCRSSNGSSRRCATR